MEGDASVSRAYTSDEFAALAERQSFRHEKPDDLHRHLVAHAHGKCGVCGATVATAQEWWMYGHGNGRCLRVRSSIGDETFNALFSHGGERI
jgi:hypothetical protein